MEEIKLFFESPIKYMKEYHLILKAENYKQITEEKNYGIIIYLILITN